MAKRPDSGTKAQNLLRRFPITDLARAVSMTGDIRRRFLENFVNSRVTISYQPTRDVVRMIYGSQPPMFDVPVEPWDRIERHLRSTAQPDMLDMNLEASKCLFALVRGLGYRATDYESKALRVTAVQVVAINIPLYLTQGERLIFQFPQPRRVGLSDNELRILGSIIHHAYAQGDYEDAEVEVADLGRPAGSKSGTPRQPVVRAVPRDMILDRVTLNRQIENVYSALRDIVGGTS